MKESYREGLANHPDPESCAGGGDAPGEALTGAHVGRVFSSEINPPACRPRGLAGEGHMKDSVQRELPFDAAESQTPSMRGNSMRENRETHGVASPDGGGGRSGKAEPKPDMHAPGESDGVIVPTKRANNAADDVPDAAESVEERTLNQGERPAAQTRHRTQCRANGEELDCAACEKQHVGIRKRGSPRCSTMSRRGFCGQSFFALKTNAAPGVDRMTWREYRHDLEARLLDLHGRVHRGAYRAQPSRATVHPEARRPATTAGHRGPGGQDRPTGRAGACSSRFTRRTSSASATGFGPNGGCQHALDALYVGINRRKVNWVLDADIRGFFDAIDHEWMMRISRAPDRRQADSPPDPQMADGRGLRGRPVVADHGRNPARGGDFAAPGERVTCTTCSTCGSTNGETETRKGT